MKFIHPQIKDKEMTSATKAKAVIPAKAKKVIAPKVKVAKIKAVPAVIEADQNICDLYSALINQQGEMEFIIEMNSALAIGKTSVRIIQASIELASVMGSAPTIKKGHAQYIQTAAKILDTQAGADNWPVAKLLKLATRLQRHAGVENITEALKVTSDIESLDEAVPVINTNKRGTKGPKDTEPVKLRSVDSILAVTFAGLTDLSKDPRNLKAQDLKTLRAVSELLKVIASNSTPKKN
jgi:hypothetical protein